MTATAEYSPVTAEEFEALMNKVRVQMDADSWHKAQTALATLKERGMPEAGTYSLTRVTATDEADLNLKVHLATAPVMKAYADGNIPITEVIDAITPLLQEVLGMGMSAILSDVTFPLTLEVPSEVAA